MDLKDKKVLVFGSGKSGIGAADLLGAEGARPQPTFWGQKGQDLLFMTEMKRQTENRFSEKQQEHTLWIFMLESFRKK